MKKKQILKRLTAFFMALLLITSCAMPASAKGKVDKEQIANSLIETAGNGLSNLLPNGESFIPLSEYNSENFFEGTGFDTKTGKWSLGSAQNVVTPDDLFEKTYYTGGGFDASFSTLFRDIGWFFEYLFKGQFDYAKACIKLISYCIKSFPRMISNKLCCKIKQKFNDMYVRTVSVDDGTGRGATVIAVVDCIGLANSDVREIRSRIAEKAGNKDAFSSITIAATHCHSCVDTQGIWTNTFEKGFFNFMKRLLRIGNPEQGYDEEYMEFLYNKVADSVISAYNNMEQGSMTYASKSVTGNGFDDYFLLKKRDRTGQIVNEMNRIVFTPDNKDSTPTMIVNMALHPYYTSIAAVDEPNNKGDGLSGDFIYYMSETICKAGYNFVFFNGALANVYNNTYVSNQENLDMSNRDSLMNRFGSEMGKMALAMTKTEDEIKADSFIYNAEYEANVAELYQKYADEIAEDYLKDDKNADSEAIESIRDYYSYHPWYENWTAAEEITLEPVLNTVFREIHIKATNPIMKLAGKLYFTSNQVLYDNKDYYIVSEIGYMELGNKVKIALMPGEIFPDLQLGGGMLTAEKSYSGKNFGYPCIREIFGEDTIVFGLANDAIGYIVPDNDYVLCFDGDNHYHELFSAGKNTASMLIQELIGIKEEISGIK